jgi:predicted membrane protein
VRDTTGAEFGCRVCLESVVSGRVAILEKQNMFARLAKGLLASLTTMLFVLVLPFLLVFLLVPSLPQDDRWFLKMAFTFLSPVTAVLWYIGFSNLVLHRRAGFLRQALVFFGSAGVIYLLLIGGVYRL